MHQYQVFRLEVRFGIGPVWVLTIHFSTLEMAQEYIAQQTDGAGYVIRRDGQRIPGIN